MEYKVRRESQSLMEKTFNRYAKHGQIPTDIVPNLIKELQPEIDVNHDDLMVMLGVADKTGSGSVDLDGFNKIALHFLLKQAKQDHDQFIHKHQIGLQDFSE